MIVRSFRTRPGLSSLLVRTWLVSVVTSIAVATAGLVPGLAPSANAAPAASASAGLLSAGSNLTNGHYLKSQNGEYKLVMQSDGNVVELMRGYPVWSTGTYGHPGAWLAMQTDGNLVVYGPGPLWSSGTGGHPGSHLALQNDANLVVYSSGGAPLWSSGTISNQLPSGSELTRSQYITSDNGEFQLFMQSDGNLVEYASGRAIWASGTYGHPGAWVTMQGDGNLVVYTSGGAALWASGTNGHPGSHLLLQDDANAVVYAPNGGPLWADGAVDTALPGGAELQVNQYLESANRAYRLVVQSDGNLVEYAGAQASWSTGTSGHPGDWLAMQTDGNLVLYGPGGALWSSGTSGHAGAALVLTPTGAVEVIGPGGAVLWSSAATSPSGLGAKIAQIAESQDQYNGAVQEIPPGSNCNPYTAYWGDGSPDPCDGNGWRSQTWCADFAAWVWRMAGVPFTYGYGQDQLNALSYSFEDWGYDNGTLIVPSSGEHVPAGVQPGDAVVWGSTSNVNQTNPPPYGQHVGIVVNVNGDNLEVVGGNMGSGIVMDETQNTTTWTENGYPIVGYIAPIAPSSGTMAASAMLPAGRTATGRQLAPAPTRKQIARDLARQDGGH